MEPLDPTKNDDTIGFPKRRISSILKASRKSIRISDPEQQENVKVESAKPVEKRMSRRVSFAPAADVLLFTKDVKNAQSPLQDLMTQTAAAAAATQNRVQVAVTADGIQQITGMETLLNAPLHASQQRDNVIFDTAADFGEKTVMFSTDDAFMDMTHCHTINIARDGELLADTTLQKDDALPARGEKTVMFSVDDGSMDMTQSHTVSITGGSLPTSRNDPGFQSFLAGLSKPGGPSSAETSCSLVQSKTQWADDVDKENQAPAHQRHKVNIATKDDCRDKTIMFTAGDDFMDMTQCHTANIGSASLALPNQNLDFFHTRGTKENASSAAMLHERKRASGLSADGLDPGFKNFLSGLFKPSGNPPPAASSQETVDTNGSLSQLKSNVGKENRSLNTTRSSGESFHGGAACPKDDVSMDMTEAQTCPIESDDPFQCLFPTPDMYKRRESQKKQEMLSGQKNSEVLRSSNRTGMETSLKPSLKTKVQRNLVKFDTEDDCGEKTVRFSTDDACMDETRSLAVNIAADFARQSKQNLDLFPACGEKTVRFSADDAAMDMTRSHTVSIGIATDFKLQSQQNVDLFPACGEKTVRFSADDAAMDMTTSLTANIACNLVSDSVLPVKKQQVETSAHRPDPRFSTSLSKPNVPSINAAVAGMTPTAAVLLGDSSNGGTVCAEDDVSMDMTEVQTGHILGITGTDGPQDMYPKNGSLKKEMTSQQLCNDALQSSDRKGMEASRTASLKTKVQRHQVKLDAEDDCREKTVRFTADDACMDVTRSHTAKIDTNFEPRSHRKVDFLPTCGEKTTRFTADDACMDVTRSHTAKIDTNFEPRSHQKVDFLPACGEKTTRFTADDACMDVTRSHTAKIDTNFERRSNHNVDFLPAYEEKKVMFTTTDATMDMTQCLAVNIASNTVSESHLPEQDSDILSTHQNMDFPLSAKKTRRPLGNQSSSAHALDPGFKNSLSRMSGPWANPLATRAPAAPSPQETVDTNGFLDQLTTPKPDVDAEKEAPLMEKSVNKTMTYSPEDDVSMDMTEAQTGRILEQTYTDEPPRCVSASQDLYPNSDHLNKAEVTSQQSNEALRSSNPDGLEITHLPDSLDTDDTKKEPINQTLSPKMESPPSVEDHDVDAAPSRKSRRKSLADLQSKLKRLSNLINTAPDAVPMAGCTAPLPPLEHDMDKSLNYKTTPIPVQEPELQLGLVNSEENTQAQCLTQGEQPSTATATPFKLQTKQLMSRLSVGSFKAKLPQRSKADDPKSVTSVGEHTQTITVSAANPLSNFDGNVSDINDEELGSYEDMSETLDMMSPQKASEEASQEFNADELLEDDVFGEDFVGAVQSKKRPLSEDEINVEDEKRVKTSDEAATDVETGLLEYDGNMTTAPIMTTQTADYSNHTASSRCEATFESTFKQSLFESQLEDYTSDVHRKLDDGTITVLEFFKLFNIDFVIHNPRQSVLPARLLSDTERTPMDLLVDRHINRPKQLVYEADVLKLTEKVEGLKERMRDLDKPLKIVNRPLWEEVRNSSEKELKSLGAKLKERNNFFRKMSKVQSHEMKEVLYADVVQANLEEQRKLRGTIEEADEMIKSLDECISELETELVAVEEKGFEGKPSLKSLQKEMQKVTNALLESDREISELEMQKTQNSNELKRLEAETRNLESHITMMHLVSEWKFGEKRDNCTIYTFLHDTLHLQLVYEKSDGNDADRQSDRKITHITFKHQLDDEKSRGHAFLVHKLLSQHIEGETDWVQKYPTSRRVPQLLHDVSLVVSRCRLLGEELRLLKMWGGLRLDVLDIRCVDTQVHFVFSSLKAFSEFEVNFSVSLIDHFYVLQVENFKNTIGNTTMQQIEEIVASFSPGKNLLTKIVKRIHENVLC